MSAVSSPRALLAALLFPVVFALIGAGALPASAAPSASASRFWGYYQLTGDQWAFATTGPDGTTPADGSVEGWRYAVATMDQPRFPRAVLTFEQICGQTAAQDGSKRVGVVIDYGRAADSADGATPPQPRAVCAVVPANATGTQVLGAVAQTRTEGAAMCGIDAHPATGCFEEVGTPSPEAAAADEPVDLAPATPASPGATATAEPTATPAATPAETAQPQGQDQQTPQTQQPQQTQEQGGAGAMTWVIVGVLVVLAAAGALIVSLRRGRR